jgi:hypothetical protein
VVIKLYSGDRRYHDLSAGGDRRAALDTTGELLNSELGWTGLGHSDGRRIESNDVGGKP